MSPTVRHEDVRAPPVVARPTPVPGRVRWYAHALLALALVCVGALALAGAAWPSPGPLFLLALPLALCMNRFVFFPNEVGVTADAAVLFAAIVGFRDGAVWLGPLLLAVLAGPLDAKHWEERAFIRMAFNSGSTALVTLVGIAVFSPVRPVLGGSAVATIGAALVAVVPYVAVESVLGVVLVALQGEALGAAVRHQLPVNAIAVPLAAAGAAAGLLVTPVGWWSTVLVLVPAAFVPEWVLVTWRRRWRRARAAGAVAAVTALGAGALVAGTTHSSATTLVVLAAGAVLLGLELAVDGRVAVPPMVASIVAASVVVSGDTIRIAVAATVAALATAIAWTGTRAAERASVAVRAVLVAAGAGVAGALVFDATDQSGRMLVAGLLAAVTCGAVALLADAPRRPVVLRTLWIMPFVATTTALAVVWRTTGAVAGVACVGAAVLAATAVASWGAPPWGSRRLGAWGARRSPRWRRVAVLTAATVALGAALATVAGPPSARWALASLAVAAAEATTAMALVGVRQWRFAPRPRLRHAAVLGAGAGLLVVVAGPFATHADLVDLAGLVVVGGTVACALAVARPLAGLGSRPAQRKPESRNASR